MKNYKIVSKMLATAKKMEGVEVTDVRALDSCACIVIKKGMDSGSYLVCTHSPASLLDSIKEKMSLIPESPDDERLSLRKVYNALHNVWGKCLTLE